MRPRHTYAQPTQPPLPAKQTRPKKCKDISRVQDDEVGDGTTSVVVLAGELLREAEQLVNQKVHPMTIIAGFREACEVARRALEGGAFAHSKAGEAELFKADLLNIAKTTLSSKILTQDKEHFAALAVDAILRLKGSHNLDAVHIIKKTGGTLRDSFLDEGFILDKKIGVGQPKRVTDAKVLIANTPMDTDKIKIYGARVRVDSMAKVADIEAAERGKMREKCEKIVAHGINCFINRQLIYNYPEELFADAGALRLRVCLCVLFLSVWSSSVVCGFASPPPSSSSFCVLCRAHRLFFCCCCKQGTATQPPQPKKNTNQPPQQNNNNNPPPPHKPKRRHVDRARRL